MMQDPPEINSRIARQIKGQRARRGLTLDALARKSGVSRSMLSLIERGESSPTAVVLDRVATGLGVPMASLFVDPEARPDPVSRQADRSSWRDPQTGYVRRSISPASFPSPLKISEIVLPGGATVAFDTAVHDPPIHQQIWVQEGRIEITVGSVTHALGADDCLAMRLDEPTAFHNPTKKPARYIGVVVSGRS